MPSDSGEKIVARIPAGGFNRFARLSRERADVDPPELGFQLQLPCQRLDEFCISRAGAAAQLMIEMADNQPLVTQTREAMEQRHRIAPAGNANQVAARARKRLGD